jgi:hypothetical protein
MKRQRTSACVLCSLLVGCVVAAPRPPSRAAASAPPSPPRPVVLEIGTSHPLVLEDISADGRWVAFCQARRDTDDDGVIEVRGDANGFTHGDALQAFFSIDGRELAIDALVQLGYPGHHAAFVRDGALEVMDVRSGDTSVLVGDVGRDIRVLRSRVDFDADGTRMMYVRGPQSVPATAALPRSAIVVRDLATGRERMFEVEAVVGFVGFEPDGQHIHATLVEQDNDGDGVLEIVRMIDSSAPPPCRPPVGVSSMHGPKAYDHSRRVLAHSDDGEFFPEPQGFVGVAAGRVVVLDPDGSLVARRGRSSEQIAAASCRPSVVRIDAVRGRIAYVCMSVATESSSGEPRAPLFEYRDGRTHDIGVLADASGEGSDDDRTIAVDDRGIYDFELGVVVEPDPSDSCFRAEATWGTMNICRERNGPPFFWDAISKRRFPIAENLVFDAGERSVTDRTESSLRHRVNSMHAVRTAEGNAAVYDLARPRLLGRVPRKGLAIDLDGRVLLPAGEANGLLVGPLRWHAPR